MRHQKAEIRNAHTTDETAKQECSDCRCFVLGSQINSHPEIPSVTYGSHSLEYGHIVKLNEKLFFDSLGIHVTNGTTTNKITNKASFLFSDGKFIYGQYSFNLQDRRYIIRIDPDTYKYEAIASFTHSITSIHMDNGIFAFANEDDDGKLYVMNQEGTRITKLAEDKASHITISGDWIYYINISDRRSIYKIKLDGSEKIKIYGNKKCSSLVFDGKYLYFQVYRSILKNNLYRIKEGDSSAEVLAKDISDFIVTDTGVFIKFPYDNGYCISFISNGDPQANNIILKSERINSININDGYLYYGMSYYINSITHRLNLRDGQIEKIQQY
jgi:hypothetical protein